MWIKGVKKIEDGHLFDGGDRDDEEERQPAGDGTGGSVDDQLRWQTEESIKWWERIQPSITDLAQFTFNLILFAINAKNRNNFTSTYCSEIRKILSWPLCLSIC